VSEKINPKRSFSVDELAALCVETMEAGKAVDIVEMDLSSKTTLAERFVLCGANSTPHINALVERVKREVSRKLKARPVINGDPASKWVVMDYGGVVVHIMDPETRSYYKLEELWKGRPDIDDEEALERLEAMAPSKAGGAPGGVMWEPEEIGPAAESE